MGCKLKLVKFSPNPVELIVYTLFKGSWRLLDLGFSLA